MKRKIILFIGLLAGCGSLRLSAMEDPSTLSFVPAEKDEDLSEYESILKETYQGHGGEGSENYILTSLCRTFPIVAGWIGNKGNRFIKILDGEKPVGF